MPGLFPESTAVLDSTKYRLLVCGSMGDSPPVLKAIRLRGFDVIQGGISSLTPANARTLLSSVDVVLFDITMSCRSIINMVQKLSAAIGICTLRPRLLCFSSVHRNPQFVLAVQKCGARYVRVSSPEMLLEAIELLIAEVDDLEYKGPRFQIVHRFSQGICTPGEEISAVLLTHSGDFLQLHLGLAERFVFDFLAQRRIAVDSLQIISGLAGDRFYREHAANSGERQVKKIRRPAVKVLTQRIRDAMASTFGRARVGFDPYDVLRSCPAEGTNRVLYKLCAEVRWRHLLQ